MCVPCQVSFFFLLTKWFIKCLLLKKCQENGKNSCKQHLKNVEVRPLWICEVKMGIPSIPRILGKVERNLEIYLEALSKYELWFAGKKYCWESDNPLLINRNLSKQKVSIFLVSLTCKTVNQTVQISFIHSLLRTLPSKMTWHLLSIYVFWGVCLPMSQVRLEPRLRNFSLMYDSRKMG